jgi:PQQ-dependent catabolism-associated CXXCW motif protein
MLKAIGIAVALMLSMLSNSAFAQKFFANENKAAFTAPTLTYRSDSYHAETPNTIPGAKTIMTEALYALTQGKDAPVLIDVLGGNPHSTIKGALWWRGAGLGTTGPQGARDMNARFAARLGAATQSDKTKAVVFFCLSYECWLSYNAALRAVEVGYTNVYWYRGGIESWKEAGNDMQQSGESTW